MAVYEVAHLTEQLDSESPTPIAPRRRGRWLVAGVGLALAIAGCMGVAVGVARTRKPASPLEHLSTLRKKLVKAFSSRALMEDADFETTATFVWNEEGAEDPSAMGVKAVFKQSTDEHDGLSFKITLLAQEGKGDDLVEKLKGVWNAVIESARSPEGPGDGFADGLANIAKISAGKGDDEAVIEVTPPSGDEEEIQTVEDDIQEVEDEIQKGINEHTEFEASVFVGRTIQEMYEHKHTSLAMLPKGIKGSVHMKVASTLFDIIENSAPKDSEDMPGPSPFWNRALVDMTKLAFAVIKNLARYNMNQKLFYKSTAKLNGVFDDYFPNLGGAIHEMAKMFFEPMPPIVRGNLTGIEIVADGVKSVEVLGLPNNWEVEATFTNVHLAPLIGDCLAEFPSTEEK